MPGQYWKQCRQLKREKGQAQYKTNSAATINNSNCGQINSNSNNNISTNTIANKTNNQKNRKSKPVYPPCETCGKTNHSIEKSCSGANAANKPPPRNKQPKGQNQVQQRNAQNNSDVNVEDAAQTLI